ncbi:MAG TPA: hypothetical protein PLV46_28475, partial [Reyranella sp.]|uniref:hypothetical protein n=1 Tax=Reyranella sp. TaxID=1929291 RepID=UPI002C09711E
MSATGRFPENLKVERGSLAIEPAGSADQSGFRRHPRGAKYSATIVSLTGHRRHGQDNGSQDDAKNRAKQAPSPGLVSDEVGTGVGANQTESFAAGSLRSRRKNAALLRGRRFEVSPRWNASAIIVLSECIPLRSEDPAATYSPV